MTVSVDAVVYFRISSAVDSVCNVEGVQKSTRFDIQHQLLRGGSAVNTNSYTNSYTNRNY